MPEKYLHITVEFQIFQIIKINSVHFVIMQYA